MVRSIRAANCSGEPGAGTRAGLDDDRLTGTLGELRADQASDEIDRTPGAEIALRYESAFPDSFERVRLR